jgi:hypothetical protein
MGGGRQSEQPDDPPTRPDTEQPHEAPTTPDAAKTGNEADHQLSGTSAKSPGQRRGRFHLRKPKIGLPAIIITALVGFFFGAASNQVSDFVKRSDDCIEGLEQYIVGVSANSMPAIYAEHGTNSTAAEKTNKAYKYINLVDAPYYKILAKCPVNGHIEYLDRNTVKDFKSHHDQMENCLEVQGCPNDDPATVVQDLLNSAQTLLKEAEEVPNWGLYRRAKYLVTHMY